MNEEKVRHIARQVYNEMDTENQYALTKVPFHVHNGSDSPRVNISSISGIPFISSDKDGILAPQNIGSGRLIFPQEDANSAIVFTMPVIEDDAANFLRTQYTLTGSLLAGATSATLSSAWTFPTTLKTVTFSNGDVRSIVFANGSASISWVGGISIGGATNTITVSGGTAPPGTCILVLNLGFVTLYCTALGQGDWYSTTLT